jgi:predicted AlkP superfamily pyrophosphatase or phosphodiesterase
MRWLIRAALSIVVLALCVGGYVWSYSGDYPATAKITRPATFKALAASSARAPSERTVVLLVFDGLPGALIRAVPSPSLERMARDGVSTLAMTPVFPTLSLPNHTSLSTGCYPARHGIVSNRFIDPERGLYAVLGDVAWNEGCEHLSQTLERLGIRTAIFGWMGTHRGDQLLVSHGGPLEEDVPAASTRMKQVIEAFQRSGDRSRFIAGYVDEPDHTLHFKGLDAPESKAMMKDVDAAIGSVLDAIDTAGAWDRTTLIVTTDHGMMPVETHFNIGGVLARAGVEGLVAADGPIAHVYLNDASTRDAAIAKLSSHAQIDVYAPDQLPGWAHLGTSKRLGDFIVVAKPPYYMFDRGIWPSHLRFAAGISPDELDERTLAAAHGYPPDIPEMAAVFFAMGAGVARGVELDGLRTIDVHPTIAALLAAAPASPIDGAAFQAALATH